MLGRGLIGGAANCGIRAGMTFGAADRTGSSRLPGTGEPGVWSASGRKTFPRPARCVPATVPAHSAALKAGRKSSPDGDRGHSPPLDRRPQGFGIDPEVPLDDADDVEPGASHLALLVPGLREPAGLALQLAQHDATESCSARVRGIRSDMLHHPWVGVANAPGRVRGAGAL